MSKPKGNSKCPYCMSDKVTLISFEFLSYSGNEKDAKEGGYFLDNELYANAKCWDCKEEFSANTNIDFDFNVR